MAAHYSATDLDSQSTRASKAIAPDRIVLVKPDLRYRHARPRTGRRGFCEHRAELAYRIAAPVPFTGH
jgi:hypothetical protein